MSLGNAYAERWIGTVRRECLARPPMFNERQRRSVLAEYEAHYNAFTVRTDLLIN